MPQSQHDFQNLFFACFASFSDFQRKFSVVCCELSAVFVPVRAFCLLPSTSFSEQHPTFDIVENCPCWSLSDEVDRVSLLQQLHCGGHMWVRENPGWLVGVQEAIFVVSLGFCLAWILPADAVAVPRSGSFPSQVSPDRIVSLPARSRASKRLTTPAARTVPSVHDLVPRAANKWPRSSPTSEPCVVG